MAYKQPQHKGNAPTRQTAKPEKHKPYSEAVRSSVLGPKKSKR